MLVLSVADAHVVLARRGSGQFPISWVQRYHAMGLPGDVPGSGRPGCSVRGYEAVAHLPATERDKICIQNGT